MNWIKAVATLGLSACLAACGGGGGSAGTSGLGGGGGGTVVSSAASVEVLASAVQVGSGGDQVTITAIVKDVGNVSLAATPVKFATDSGTLTSAAAVTDASGVATALMSAGADKSNRTVTVTVTSGSVSGKIVLDVVGTTLSYSGVTTVALGAKVTVAVKATDSKGTVISHAAITVASSLNNGLSATGATTDAQGNATVDYTATNSGTDSLSFKGVGAAATASIQISAADFNFVSPVAGTQIPVSTPQSVSVRYLSNGVPQSGITVNFAATAGVVSPASAITNASGIATTSISSSTASPATIQATLAKVTAQATLPIIFVATTPAKLVLQVSPTAIGPNPGGGTAQQAQLLATVTDANGNPVTGASVDFNRLADPSGGNLTQASAVTDTSGHASVQYIAGALTTASNGVQVRASVAGTTPLVEGDASLTVNQSALFIALGTGNTISNLDEQTYKKDWVVYVTDANGIAVPNITLTIKVLPVEYGKGRLSFQGKGWSYAPGATFCPNEDTNYNGIVDAAKDTNGSGTLEPGNVISVTTAATGATGSTGTVKTDATGRATISLIYAESYAPWVGVRLRAEAVVSGTESSKEATFVVGGVASDFNVEAVPPAGVESPFGVNGCAAPN